MFYREAGDFKTSYVDDGQTFPIKFDRIRYYAVLAVALLVVPFIINDYWANAVFVPFLAIRRPDALLENDLTALPNLTVAGILEDDGLCVGKLLIVVEEEFAPQSADA